MNPTEVCVFLFAPNNGGLPDTHVQQHVPIVYYSDQGLQRLVSELTGRVTHLCLWCAGVVHTDIPPELQAEVLTTPLRSAPSVLREVRPALGLWSRVGKVNGYSDSGLPAPGDGPSVVRLYHRGDGHTSEYPVDCVQCGHDVAIQLSRLGVGEWIR